MKIVCPNCKLTGQTSDLNIPPEGRYMDCPRCKSNFLVQKEKTANWADTMTECPGCGYSSFNAERFDICPQCGLVAKDHNDQRKQQPSARIVDILPEEPAVVDRELMRKELERLEQEENKKRRQRAESTSAPLLREDPVEAIVVPAPVRLLGWAFILVALALLAYGGKGVYDYMKITPAEAVTTQYEEYPSSFQLYLTYGLSPFLMVILGCYFAVSGSQFMRMRSWGRKGVEAAAWLGVLFIFGRELASLIEAVRRASSDAELLYYLVEFAGFILMTVLWSAPLFAAIWYLRGDFFKEEFGQ